MRPEQGQAAHLQACCHQHQLPVCRPRPWLAARPWLVPPPSAAAQEKLAPPPAAAPDALAPPVFVAWKTLALQLAQAAASVLGAP